MLRGGHLEVLNLLFSGKSAAEASSAVCGSANTHSDRVSQNANLTSHQALQTVGHNHGKTVITPGMAAGKPICSGDLLQAPLDERC